MLYNRRFKHIMSKQIGNDDKLHRGNNCNLVYGKLISVQQFFPIDVSIYWYSNYNRYREWNEFTFSWISCTKFYKCYVSQAHTLSNARNCNDKQNTREIFVFASISITRKQMFIQLQKHIVRPYMLKYLTTFSDYFRSPEGNSSSFPSPPTPFGLNRTVRSTSVRNRRINLVPTGLAGTHTPKEQQTVQTSSIRYSASSTSPGAHRWNQIE